MIWGSFFLLQNTISIYQNNREKKKKILKYSVEVEFSNCKYDADHSHVEDCFMPCKQNRFIWFASEFWILVSCRVSAFGIIRDQIASAAARRSNTSLANADIPYLAFLYCNFQIQIQTFSNTSLANADIPRKCSIWLFYIMYIIMVVIVMVIILITAIVIINLTSVPTSGWPILNQTLHWKFFPAVLVLPIRVTSSSFSYGFTFLTNYTHRCRHCNLQCLFLISPFDHNTNLAYLTDFTNFTSFSVPYKCAQLMKLKLMLW